MTDAANPTFYRKVSASKFANKSLIENMKSSLQSLLEVSTSSILLACSAAALHVPAAAQSADAEARAAWVQQCEDWDDWDKPAPPFRIFGNSYYVGTCGISSILIAGEEGHILIDGGTEAGADLIAANIEALGFALEDVDILLFSHEHHDHVGGLARLQELTGAVVLSSQEGRFALATGAWRDDDPQVGELQRFTSPNIAGIAQDNMAVEHGNLRVMGWDTPGHSPGAMSWQWGETQDGEHIVLNYIDSLSPISSDGYRFTDHPAYVEAFRHSIFRLGHVGCGILLTPHPSASAMRERLATTGLVADSTACARYSANRLEQLEARLAQESAE